MIDGAGRDLIIARVERVVVEYQVAFQNVAVLQPEMTVGIARVDGNPVSGYLLL
jgi:hypothetical protein